jgi:colanic acid biosynthesis glycosyl transferase WcaI
LPDDGRSNPGIARNGSLGIPQKPGIGGEANDQAARVFVSEVLIISINYWPEASGIAPYSTQLAEHLASVGHQVSVLTGFPHYPGWRVHEGYRGWTRGEEHNGVRVERRRHYVPARQSALRRAVYEATFVAMALPYSLATRPDVILGVVPSLGDGVLARITAGRAHAGYGIILQDLMSSAAEQSGIGGGRFAAQGVRRIERWAVARATVIAPVSESFIPYLRSTGIPDERIALLRNWVHVGIPTRSRVETRNALGWREDEWVVLHAGNMGLKQGLEQIVRAAKTADEENSPIRFVLMGDGSQHALIEGLANGTSRISFHPFVDAAELPNVLAAADVLLISERDSVVDMSLPSKLTSYFAAGRPVVAAVHPGGATAREVERAGAGVVSPAGQPSELVAALMQLRRDPEKAQRMGANGARYAEASLARTEALERAEALVGRVAQQTAMLRGRR